MAERHYAWFHRCPVGHTSVQMHTHSPGGYCRICKKSFGGAEKSTARKTTRKAWGFLSSR